MAEAAARMPAIREEAAAAARLVLLVAARLRQQRHPAGWSILATDLGRVDVYSLSSLETQNRAGTQNKIDASMTCAASLTVKSGLQTSASHLLVLQPYCMCA